MSKDYPLVPLGEAIHYKSDFIEIDDFQIYKRCRVQLHAQGIVERDAVPGAEIKTKKQQVCKANEFLVAEIDAKLGGFGIVPENLEGAIVSSHYFLFSINEDVLNRRYLNFFIRTPDFMDQVRAKGSTNYAAIRPGDVLGYEIPLPTPEEQQRIVARIEELAAKIEEARVLSQQLISHYEEPCRSIIFYQSGDGFEPTPMHTLVKLREPDVLVRPEERYSFAGVYCFGKGVFRGQNRYGTEFAYKRLTRLHANNFVYPKLMAWEGALAVVSPEYEGLVVSPEFPVFEIDEEKVLPETLDIYFRTPAIWPILSGESTGTNVRRRRLNPSDFLAFQISLPPMKRQQLLRKVRQKVDMLKRKQAENSAELDALLPSVLDKAFKGEL